MATISVVGSAGLEAECGSGARELRHEVAARTRPIPTFLLQRNAVRDAAVPGGEQEAHKTAYGVIEAALVTRLH